ncbi:hypothetical protein D3C85_1558020 [compost metagenome]
MQSEDHEVEQHVAVEHARFQVLQVFLMEGVRHEKSCARQHPVVGVAHQQDMTGRANVGDSLVAEQEMGGA